MKMGKLLGFSAGIFLSSAILLLIPGEQPPFVGFLLGFSLTMLGMILGSISDGVNS